MYLLFDNSQMLPNNDIEIDPGSLEQKDAVWLKGNSPS